MKVYIHSASDGRGNDYESVLVAQFIHAYVKRNMVKLQKQTKQTSISNWAAKG